MIQLLGLRDTTTGSGKLYDAFFERGWKVPDIFDLFANMQNYVSRIPEVDRWNLFYTVATCTDEKRVFKKQDVIPIDIDGIVRGTEKEVVDAVLAELKLDFKDVGVVYSGNGVHLLIGLKNPIESRDYINANKAHYRALCGRVDQALFNEGLQGKSDPVVFSEARLLRLPFTKNIKKNKPNSECVLIQSNITPLDVDLFSLADMPMLTEGEYIHPRALARMPDPDREAIEKGCSFIKHCRETREAITEPEWYAMLSVVGRFKEGEKWAHVYSRTQGNRHPNYSVEITDRKLKHALEASGPRTCQNISGMYEGCQTCPHFNKITSPIQIIGTETIRTQFSGFYTQKIDSEGVIKSLKPCYDDLEKFFRRKYEYVTIEEDQTTMIYNGMFWEVISDLRVHKFAEDNFNPTPTTGMCLEFQNKLKRMHLVPANSMIVQDKLNFQNGVLDLETQVLEDHNSKYKFTYVIPYDYAPRGDCSIFKKFLNDVSCDDQEIVQMLAEYVGYCISGTDPELVQKCALLYGDGSNGKSVLINLMREMVGPQNCSAIGLASLKKDTHRYSLMNKLFNACAESPSNSFLDSEDFKNMVGGDTVEVRKLYGDPIMWKCTTKLMFACNELPFNGDFSHGLYRRLIILPFRNTFSHEKGNLDPLILQKMLTERSDIFKYCLDAFAKCKDRGYKFIEPKVSTEEMEDYKEMGDVVSRFTYGMCLYNASQPYDKVLHLDTVYNLFAMWCKDNNQGLISYGSFVRRFGKIIQRRYPKIEKSRPRADSTEGGRGTAYRYLVINAVNPAQF